MSRRSELDDDLLLEFLARRETACPACGFSLRGIASSRCPECGRELVLQLGTRRLSLGWLVLVLAPSMFSGIAGGLLGMLLLRELLSSGGAGIRGGVPIEVVQMFVVALVSVLVAGTLWARRWWFVTLPAERQVTVAILWWMAHVAAFFAIIPT